jgi:hypothetical protein
MATIPFAITFRAEMGSAQVARLSSELGLTFHSNPKLNLPFVAFVRLSFDSGLYLLREQGDRWRLECRTYGRPTEALIRGWRLHAEWVVDQIDSSTNHRPEMVSV